MPCPSHPTNRQASRGEERTIQKYFDSISSRQWLNHDEFVMDDQIAGRGSQDGCDLLHVVTGDFASDVNTIV